MEEIRARTADGLEVAAIDFGGRGEPIVLIHGANANAAYFRPLAQSLAPRRSVAIDLRGSGQSDPQPDYDWEGYLLDIDAVVATLGLGNPPVVGHSFGGFVAAKYGAAHPECPGVVNIDGWCNTRRREYGVPSDVLDALKAEASSAPPIDAGPGDDGWLATQKAEKSATWAAWYPAIDSAERALIRELVGRSFVHRNGEWIHQPNQSFWESVWDFLSTGDEFELYRAVRCPLLIFLCTGVDWLRSYSPHVTEATATNIKGLWTDLESLAEERSNVSISAMDCDHIQVVSRMATQTAQTIESFLQK